MHNKTIKKGSLFLVAFISLLLISGCETISAIDKGEVKMQDAKEMIKLGIANTGEVGEQSIFSKITERIDTWMQKNLW